MSIPVIWQRKTSEQQLICKNVTIATRTKCYIGFKFLLNVNFQWRVKKTYVCNLIPSPINTTTPLLRPKSFYPMVIILTEFHCTCIIYSGTLCKFWPSEVCKVFLYTVKDRRFFSTDRASEVCTERIEVYFMDNWSLILNEMAFSSVTFLCITKSTPGSFCHPFYSCLKSFSSCFWSCKNNFIQC